MKKNANLSVTANLKLEFWTAFNNNADKNVLFSKTFKTRKPQAQHWYDLSVGSSAYHICLTVNTQKSLLTAGLYIDDNKSIFEKFKTNESILKSILGGEIEWRDAKKASRFMASVSFDINASDSWIEGFDWLYDKSIKIKEAVNKIMK